jgi:UDP-3-O-[3-hydroxymyristoyl] glucosamine N-acyltransferase
LAARSRDTISGGDLHRIQRIEMNYSLGTLLEKIGILYDGRDVMITKLHTLSEADATALSFLSDTQYINALSKTKAAAVLIPEAYLDQVPEGVITVPVEDPYLCMAKLSRFFAYAPSVEEGTPSIGTGAKIAKSVRFGEDVVIGKNVSIMPGCYIGDGVEIADGTVLYANVTVYHHCRIGRECILHSGVVIGADGYGFTHDAEGSLIKIYQNGTVHIGARVEIGANSTIDRAVFGSTDVGDDTKIDNLVQIAHNCKIGKACLLVCQTALAGSTVLEDGVVMGGQSGATGHLTIGSRARVASRAGVTKSLPGGETYGGFPAIEQKRWLKMQAKLQSLIKKK